MKLLITTLFFLTSLIIYAQPTVGSGSHRFKQIVILAECDALGAQLPGSIPRTVPANSIFHIDGITGTGDYIITFPTWILPKANSPSYALKTSLNTNLTNTGGTQHYFLLTPNQYNQWAEKVPPRGNFAVYASSTLVKIRPGRNRPMNGYPIYFDFTNDVNLGVMAGVKWNRFLWVPGLKVNTLVGFGVSSIPADSSTTQGKIKTGGNNQAAITPSFAIVGEIDKFQLGLSIGIDLMSGETGRSWIYRRRPWIGIGFGFNLFRSQGDDLKNR